MRDLEVPDRVLIGGEQTKSGLDAIESLVKIYSSWVPKKNILKIIVKFNASRFHSEK